MPPTFGSVVLNASGTGTLRFAPSGREWSIETISVKATTSVLEASCSVYIGAVSAVNLHSSTVTGSSGDTNQMEIPIILRDGNPIFVVWTGGDVGATATAVLTGSETGPGGGFRVVY
jgi:hypothetical protein